MITLNVSRQKEKLKILRGESRGTLPFADLTRSLGPSYSWVGYCIHITRHGVYIVLIRSYRSAFVTDQFRISDLFHLARFVQCRSSHRATWCSGLMRGLAL